MNPKINPLKLENQLCFPLYAAAKEVVRKYKNHLKPLGLTYTQYITMMILWEENQVTESHLGEKLLLDSGTLTPMLKKMESQGLISRQRSKEDERNLLITITPQGIELRKKALKVPQKMASCISLSPEEASTLYQLLYKVIGERPAKTRKNNY